MSGGPSRGTAAAIRRLGLVITCAWSAVSGCAHGTGTHNGITGGREDSQVEDGSYDGWEIKRDCDVSNSVTVIGTGAHWSQDVAPGAPDTDRGRALEEFQRQLDARLSGLRSIHTTGLVYACSGMAGGVTLDDWREVDRAVQLAARLLRERDLREQVVLIVAPRAGAGPDAAPM